jgi:hypothetical protein
MLLSNYLHQIAHEVFAVNQRLERRPRDKEVETRPYQVCDLSGIVLMKRKANSKAGIKRLIHCKTCRSKVVPCRLSAAVVNRPIGQIFKPCLALACELSPSRRNLKGHRSTNFGYPR